MLKTKEVASMSQWSRVLSAAELDEHYALTAKIDPNFAERERAFYESCTAAQLDALAHQAWLSNNATSYQLAVSHKGI